MKEKSIKTHYANPSQPQKTACGIFWALQDRGIITLIQNAVDDWEFVTCKNCLKRK